MKFARLRLTGFKSFCETAELVLEPGLTGVVGPNGCGKSNLMDALRWVMGESSYKAMRAGGMDEVIFSGSAGRPARNWAEVTLTIDNSDRTAPAPLNTADLLEVTRRIERESGSVYRVNGREVRARDVQLLFADASTGAQSPALVGQGRIGQLIAAKPTQRRVLLEEAAGISGLHSRRQEAELRLRAAEQNLERVDDVIAQVAGQLETLRRQARLATRYKALSGDIRRAEAGLFHIRWVAARVAEKEAEAEQGRLVVRLGDAMSAERKAAATLEEANAALKPLREAEAAAAARVQRLTILLEQLAGERRQAEERRRELEKRLGELEADAVREGALAEEAARAAAGLDEEKVRLEAEEAGERAAREAAEQETQATAAAVAAAEEQARAAAEALAAIRARRAEARRGAEEAAARVARVRAELDKVARERAGLGADVDEQAAEQARAALEAAQARAASAEAALLAAEAAVRAAEAALDSRRPALAETEKALSRLESEAETLARILKAGTGSDRPGIVEALRVAPGYEKALGAALGDDLEAPADPGVPLHWAGPYPAQGDPALPEGATPLSTHVSGSPLLERRLAQIGLVAEEDGPRLASLLKPGQLLVTRQGALWRWDGLVAAANAPSAAAERLRQKNRLAELDGEIAGLAARRAEHRAALDELATRLADARAAERQEREAGRTAQREIAAAQAALDRAQRAAGERRARVSALEEARLRLEAALAEAEAGMAEADRLLASSGGEDAAATNSAEANVALAAARSAHEKARLALGGLETAARLRAQRLDRIGGELADWRRRAEAGQVQRAVVEERRASIAAALASERASPDDFTARRAALDEEIAAAREAHAAAADRLAEAETAARAADKGQRGAAEALGAAREQLARIEERLKGYAAQRQQIERQVEDTLGISARQTAEAAGIRPQDALPEEEALERRLERLRAERERLGGVNLSAEREAEDLAEKHEAMVRDRDDLIAAIGKLRAGIQSLNREGRQRLLDAFAAVNGHFRDLFATLFGGGSAELSLVESDDPLEAGLEIIARPPGKKPATMTLLSGGEQALVALSLIFAVFLTNPAPICVLDEVDAPLDDANVERFCTLLQSMRARTETRFLVITHNPITMSRVDRLFGVTMSERGVSQLVSVDLRQAESFLEAV